MRRTTVIVAALGIFVVIGSTPASADVAASTDELAQFKLVQFAQYQATETVGASSTTKKKKKPKKKQRYERSN